MANSQNALLVKSERSEDILAIEGVAGIGVGFANPDNEDEGSAIVIYSEDGFDVEGLLQKIGPSITSKSVSEEIPTRIIASGGFFANEANTTPEWAFEPMAGHPEYRRRIRPLQPGYSVGTTKGSGTAGLIVIDYPERRKLFIASNCHVLNGGNDSSYYETLQPGGADGGISGRDTIGRAYQYIKLKQNNNYLDAATAIPLSNSLLNPDYPTVGSVPGHYKQYRVGWKLYKVGRTTGPVRGVVEAVHADIRVNYGKYGGLGTIEFKDQTVITSNQAVSLPGDSGSIWLKDADKYACAVNYAGGGDGKRSISYPFNWFASAFKVRVAKNAKLAGDIIQSTGYDEIALFTKELPEQELDLTSSQSE